jgi:DNA-directed RNA polymerase subunit omega
MSDTLSLLADNNLDKFDSRYRMVLVAAQRAKQLMQGGKRSETSKFTKETSLALEEILHGIFNGGRSARCVENSQKIWAARI